MSASSSSGPPTPENERAPEEIERLAEELADHVANARPVRGDDGWAVELTVLADPEDPGRDPGWDEEADDAPPPTVTRRLDAAEARAYFRACEDMLVHLAWRRVHARAKAEEAADDARDVRDETAPVPHTWDGEPFEMRAIHARTKEASRWLHTYLQDPDRAASPNQDLRRLERFTMLSFSVRLAIYHLILRLHAAGAGEAQVAAAAGLEEPALAEARTMVVDELGDLTNFTEWTKRITSG